MFKCDLCGKITSAGEPCTKVVLETKNVVHVHRRNVFKIFDEGERKRIWIDDPGGQGVQIAKEVNACQSCAKNFKDI
jgi:hypothetical protein